MININDILQFTNIYNKKNNNIQQIITLISNILIYLDKIKFIIKIYNLFLLINSKIDTEAYTNINKVKIFVLNEYKIIIDDIIQKSEILQELNDILLSSNLIWQIIRYISSAETNILNQQIIDKLINYLYHMVLTDNRHINNNLIYNYNEIPYTDKELKEVFVKDD